MTIAQILAVIIFVAMFILIVSEKIERHYVTMGCGLLMIVLVFGFCMHDTDAIKEALSFHSFFTANFWYQVSESAESSVGINWATIIFIAGMMLMVEGMGHAGFFRWLCLRIAKAVKYQTIPIFITFMIMSSLLAMFIDSITVILFLAAVTVELAQLLKFDPIPMIIPEIFCANLGGSATMCGDPPNIIIGTSLGYSFGDFIFNTGVMAAVSLVFVLFYFYFYFRKDLMSKHDDGAAISYPEPKDAITNKKDFTISCLIFLCAVVMLVSHAQTGLTVSTIGIVIGGATLIASGRMAPALIKKVDYKTLLFFIGLFVVVSGLEQTGVLDFIAAFIANVSGDNAMLTIAIVIWVSAVASAFVDNIPFAATMIPVITSLSQSLGISLPVLAWALSMGTDIGGSATPIGASANVVGISVAAKEGYMIGWNRYCRSAAPATILVVLLSMICIYIRYF